MPFPPAVVNRLAQFSGPNVQSVRVGEFHQCFDVLLSHQSCPLNLSWAKAKLHLAAHDNNAGFKASTIVSRTCLRAAAVDRQPDWPAVYLLAMIWGFGETNGKPAKDGPPKLFVSTQTADVAIKLDKVAAEVVAGNLAASFDAICTRMAGQSSGKWALRSARNFFYCGNAPSARGGSPAGIRSPDRKSAFSPPRWVSG